MKFVKQNITIPVKPIEVESTNKRTKHGLLFPNNIRAILVAPSGGGKTSALISLLTDLNGLRFKNVYIYTTSLFQPQYQFLKQVLDKIKEIGFYHYGDSEDVDIHNVKPGSIFIFDDIPDQLVTRPFFSQGKKSSYV